MRTYNKRLVKFSAVGVLAACVISLVIIAHGCSSDFDSDIKIEKLEIPEEYNEVGVLHNEGLEYIFEEIKAYGIEYTQTPRLKSHPFMQNKDEFIKQATLDFCNQHEKLRKHVDIIASFIEEDVLSLKSTSVEHLDPIVQHLLDEITSILSQEFKNNDIAQLKVRLDLINQKAAEILSETDAPIIYCATSTSYYSYQYWQENYGKWYFALNYPEILERYTNEELNQLKIRNGKIKTKGWMGDMFNTVENWFNSTTDSIEEWWNNHGEDILIADGVSAAYGAGKAFITAGAETLVFGPTGLVVKTVSGAVIYGIEGSALGIITISIFD